VVVGDGRYDARLVVIGEAPGQTEDQGGRPFIGRSGKLLFQLIEEVTALTREQCYVTNVVKCRPPGNRTPTTAEISACRPWLEEQMDLFGPTVVLSCGNTATRSLLQTDLNIGALHGKAYQFGRGALVPTYHPSAALRGGASVVQAMRDDLGTVVKVLATLT
jgi:DNA polymerase